MCTFFSVEGFVIQKSNATAVVDGMSLKEACREIPRLILHFRKLALVGLGGCVEAGTSLGVSSVMRTQEDEGRADSRNRAVALGLSRRGREHWQNLSDFMKEQGEV
jgi:hypothetical protein